MKPFRPLVIVLLTLVASAPFGARAIVQSPPTESEFPVPSRAWQPGDVVRIIVEALADNDRPYPDAGIATTFRFSSPANRAYIGPLDAFARMVRSAPYALLVDHASHDYSKLVFIDGDAYQMVNLVSADGRGVVYAFQLSRQRGGEFDGMWMTEAVWPVARHGKGAVPPERSPVAR